MSKIAFKYTSSTYPFVSPVSSSCAECPEMFPLFSSLSHQPPTHVKGMMDVVPAHICASSITTAPRPAPVRTLWSSHPTNNPASVSDRAPSSFFTLSFLMLSERNYRMLCKQQERRLLYMRLPDLLIDVGINAKLQLSHPHLDPTATVCKG